MGRKKLPRNRGSGWLYVPEPRGIPHGTELVSTPAESGTYTLARRLMHRRGFTIIELVIAITVGGILLSIAIAGFGAVESRTAARQARNAFAGLHARARAQAIEFGTRTMLMVDVDGDSVWIARNDTVLETVRFADEFGVDLTADGSRYALCMSPRGFADPDCTSFSGGAKLAFERSGESMTATMLPMGQLGMPGNR